MKLFEYMGKDLFRRYGIPTPKGKVIQEALQAGPVAEELGEVVIKTQILSGKRGKAGGIKFAGNPAEAVEAAQAILGQEFNGLVATEVLVEEKLQIEHELYLAIVMEGSLRGPILLASQYGGMDIEEVPEEHMVKMPIDLHVGIQPYFCKEVARRLNLTGELGRQFSEMLVKLYRLFREKDCELVEINPLVISGDRLIAADAKVTIDDEALYRQPDLPRVEERNEAEQKAHAIGLSFVQLDGDIAIMANGAGITMATLDVINHYGGAPANFLDAGGGANVEQTAQALELLLSTNPKAIFINIFGGITRCDDVAKAFLQVNSEKKIDVPVVIRLVGTNQELGVKLLQEQGIVAYEQMQEAAMKTVALAKGMVG
ncbi:MAG: ADP-forming succinate--CoA ligase subunit beta [Clostridia bacterium]|nr:ADP-forming succinate--CoA ligase subunit beta [Clostridia bacterium]